MSVPPRLLRGSLIGWFVFNWWIFMFIFNINTHQLFMNYSCANIVEFTLFHDNETAVGQRCHLHLPRVGDLHLLHLRLAVLAVAIDGNYVALA